MKRRTATRPPQPSQAKAPGAREEPPTIQVWAPEDLGKATLVREDGESDEQYAKRKQAVEWLLNAARR